MSRPPNSEFQEWWNKQRATDRDLLADKSDGFTRSFLTVDIPTVPSDRESVEKERARSARQLSWVCLLRFQQIASSLAWLSNGFLSLLRTANRRITSPDSLSDSKSSRLYRVIKVFLAVVLLLLVFELVAYFKGWYFSPPTARADVYGMIDLIYAKWLEIRADYLATPLQSLTNMCIVLFLVQSIVRVIWILRCCWIKLRGLKPVASVEYPTNAKNDDVNVEDYPMVLVQIPMCNEREANETNEDSNAKKRSKPNESEGTENGSVKVEEESKGGATSNDGGDEKQTKGNSSKPPEPPKDYIHVRARRGQATDSHSLAERGRREKISERMKLLQDLVPGCNKITGKAHMLDEIINYVQSLQRQVEFLSGKLASVNTRLDFNIDNLISKDMLQSSNSLSHRLFPLDSSAQAFYGQHTQQNPGIHNNILNGVMSHSTVDPLETASLSQNMGMQLPPLNGFNEGGYQFLVEFCEDDLHTFVQMGFGQSGAGKSHSQNFNGSNQVTHLKVEP